MRGKLFKVVNNGTRNGITPADAGKTCHKATLASASRDHPRGCGENHGALRAGLYPEGSPPRMRGKRRDSDSVHRATRITPADAGKTPLVRHPAGAGRDHPRGCGENKGACINQRRYQGSPPRMRGKRYGTRTLSNAGGITPADAGKTLPSALR